MMVSLSPWHMYSSRIVSLLCLLVVSTDAFYVNTGQNGSSLHSEHRGREVYSPPITNPDASTTWHIGSTVEVSWDVSSIPQQLTNYEGKIVLGYMDKGTDEHLDLDNPLADGFNITEGHIQVEVPNVSPSDDYIIVCKPPFFPLQCTACHDHPLRSIWRFRKS